MVNINLCKFYKQKFLGFLKKFKRIKVSSDEKVWGLLL